MWFLVSIICARYGLQHKSSARREISRRFISWFTWSFSIFHKNSSPDISYSIFWISCHPGTKKSFSRWFSAHAVHSAFRFHKPCNRYLLICFGEKALNFPAPIPCTFKLLWELSVSRRFGKSSVPSKGFRLARGYTSNVQALLTTPFEWDSWLERNRSVVKSSRLVSV